jgi:hypothetical protein
LARSRVGREQDLKDKGSVNINSDPYGNGWMIKLKLTNQAEVNDLLDSKSYEVRSSPPSSCLVSIDRTSCVTDVS